MGAAVTTTASLSPLIQKKKKKGKSSRLMFLLLIEVCCLGVPFSLLTATLFFQQVYHGPLLTYIESFRISHKGADERGLYYSLDADVTYYHRQCTKEDITTSHIANKTDRSNLLIIPEDTTPDLVEDVMMTHGAVILPEVLSEETASNLRTYLESRHAIQDQLGWQEKFFTGMNRLSLGVGFDDDPSIQQAIYEIGTNERIQTTLTGLFGTPDAAIIETSTLTTMHGAENQGLHSDSDFFGSSLLYARTFLHSYTMFIALQDTTSRMGATTVCPGTHWCANEDMHEFCLPHEYEYDDDGSDQAFADYNNNEAFDVSSNGITAKQSGVLRKGDAMMFNQNAFHRGPQNDDPNHKDTNRAMFIVTFVNKRDYEKYGDVRQQGMGTYYYQRWTMWGHLFSDFKLALSSIKTTTWTQPWATLKTCGVMGGNAVTWTEHVARQFANQMDFYDPGELPEFKQYLELTIGEIVSHLHQGTSNSDWHEYIPRVLENAVQLAKTVYIVGLIVSTCLSLLLSPRDGRGTLLLRLVMWHVLIGSLGYGALYGLEHYSFLGRKIISQEIHATAFPRHPSIPPNTTFPDRMDFLVGTRYDADFLGSYNRALDYHPGNIKLNTIIENFGASELPLHCHASLIWKQWQAQNKANPLRMLLQDAATGYWTLMPDTKDILKRMVLKLRNPLLEKVDTHLLQVLANARFGRRRDTVMAQRFEKQMVQHWQHVFFSSLMEEQAAKPKATLLMWNEVIPQSKAKLITRMTKALGRTPSPLLHDSSIPHYLSPGSRVWAASTIGDSWEGRWESAKIIQETGDGFVRVVYDKNGVKQRLLPDMLVQPFRHMVQGDNIQVLHETEQDSFSWQDGTILSASPLGFYSVRLQQGSILPRIAANNLRLPPPTSKVNAGDTVWATTPTNEEDSNTGYWKRAKVVEISVDWVVVEYLGEEPVMARVSLSDVQPYFSIEVGDVVEALLNDGDWWEAHVARSYTRNHGEELFSVYVGELDLYLEALAARYVRPLPPLLNAGTRVMGNFGDDGNWFPGTIEKVYTEDRTYHVQYDDGDYEEFVPRDRIQVNWANDDEEVKDDK
jgi:ectoine hydroxylase-related dioxygenase (phytanoyl-CoA dioxygenase family)